MWMKKGKTISMSSIHGFHDIMSILDCSAQKSCRHCVNGIARHERAICSINSFGVSNSRMFMSRKLTVFFRSTFAISISLVTPVTKTYSVVTSGLRMTFYYWTWVCSKLKRRFHSLHYFVKHGGYLCFIIAQCFIDATLESFISASSRMFVLYIICSLHWDLYYR